MHHCILYHAKLLNNLFSIFPLLKNCALDSSIYLKAILGCLNDLEVCICIIYLYIYIYIYIYIYAAISVASSVTLMAYWLRCWIPNPGVRVQNHWTAPRLTQPFILLRLVKWVPAISGDLVITSKLPPRSGSNLEAIELHP